MSKIVSLCMMVFLAVMAGCKDDAKTATGSAATQTPNSEVVKTTLKAPAATSATSGASSITTTTSEESATEKPTTTVTEEKKTNEAK